MTGELQQLIGPDGGFKWVADVIAERGHVEHTPMKVRSILQHRSCDFTSIGITTQ
ncbi:hypothetical protein ALQ97_102410 [Pseudomonas savastanoi pv. glycinea]|nr:hypothetical protein ALQ97_102410 [Pseudomonas savastanoi pv. glycinea]